MKLADLEQLENKNHEFDIYIQPFVLLMKSATTYVRTN